jgi:hypothetical protein
MQMEAVLERGDLLPAVHSGGAGEDAGADVCARDQRWQPLLPHGLPPSRCPGESPFIRRLETTLHLLKHTYPQSSIKSVSSKSARDLRHLLHLCFVRISTEGADVCNGMHALSLQSLHLPHRISGRGGMNGLSKCAILVSSLGFSAIVHHTFNLLQGTAREPVLSRLPHESRMRCRAM